MLRLIRALIIASLFIATATAGTYNSVVKAFENTPEYVAPVATLLGTINGNGWNQHSSLGKEFKFYFSIPITLAVIADEDRSYSGVHVSQEYADFVKLVNLPNPDPRMTQSYTTPTIFGRKPAPTLYNLNFNDETGAVSSVGEVLLSDGVENLSKFNWLPAPALQFQTEALFSSLSFRYLFFPNKKIKAHLPGFSFRHDLSSLFREMPFSMTLFTTHSFQAVNWEPGENIKGTLELRGNSGFSGITLGKKINEKVDIFLESGYEYSGLSTGGRVVIYDDDAPTVPTDTITPGMDLEGRSSFKAGLQITVTPGKKGSYSVSGGGGAGSEQYFSFTPLHIDFSKRDED